MLWLSVGITAAGVGSCVAAARGRPTLFSYVTWVLVAVIFSWTITVHYMASGAS
jgi:preprotein translocase subunit SecG